MKKILNLVFLGMLTTLLFACAKQDSLDGEYYWISEHRNEVAVTINDKAGEWKQDDGFTITNVDTEKKQITYQGSLGIERTVNYTLSDDGILTFNDYTYYKKDSDAYIKALKEFGYNNK